MKRKKKEKKEIDLGNSMQKSILKYEKLLNLKGDDKMMETKEEVRKKRERE